MFSFKGVSLKVVKGDITELEADAVVNPANSFGYMGGGVALAIKRKGGEEIEKEAVSKAPIPVGKAVGTTAGRLKAKRVIHAPTMEKPAGETSQKKIGEATLAALLWADENGVKSVAFPGMGTGVGGVAYKDAARAMVKAIKEFLKKRKKVSEIILVAYHDELHAEFIKAVKDIL